ncbi:MAG: hypothetical protein MJ237_08905 [bacterium]|nr:hypothetical protein [bacterium]
MKVLPIASNQYYSKTTNNYPANNIRNNLTFRSLPCDFSTAFQVYRDIHGISRCTQNTTGLRNDLDYAQLARKIRANMDWHSIQEKKEPVAKKISNLLKRLKKDNLPEISTQEIKQMLSGQPHKKAKIYSMAGSDGTEAYAIANALIGELGFENAKKYVFPIYVNDVKEWVINEYGKAGKIWFDDDEIEKLPYIREFLVEECHEPKRTLYTLKQEFRDCFEFEVADLQAVIDRLSGASEDEYPTFVIRNCLADAFGSLDAYYVIKDLVNKYPSDADIVLGGYDLGKFKNSFFDTRTLWLSDCGNNTFQSFKKYFDEILHSHGS